MQLRELTINDLLQRVDIANNLEETIKLVLNDYDLGVLASFEPLLVGHEELNVIIITTQGKYVIKFINKRKSQEVAAGLVRAMIEFYNGNIPVTKLYQSRQGLYLYQMGENVGKGFLFVADFFDGKTFNEVEVTDNDLKMIAKYLAMIHRLDFEPCPEYDFWLPQYLVKEFKEKSKYLSSQDLLQVKNVISIFDAIDFNKCNKTIGHYDAHRDNIKKDKNNNICFFDLATVDKNYSIFDLGAFLGFFLFSTQSLSNYKKRYNLILGEYLKYRELNQYEIDHLFDCMKIIYASNVLASNYLIKVENDNTNETMKWYKLGKWGLDTFLELSNKEWINI